LSITDIFSATIRAIKSEPPPGGNPTTILSGLFGNGCAHTKELNDAKANKTAVNAVMRNRLLRAVVEAIAK
jgi:hypothetical protein